MKDLVLRHRLRGHHHRRHRHRLQRHREEAPQRALQRLLPERAELVRRLRPVRRLRRPHRVHQRHRLRHHPARPVPEAIGQGPQDSPLPQ